MFFLKKLLYHFLHGWHSVYPPLDPAAVMGGQTPLVWRQWLNDLEVEVASKASAFYGRPIAITERFDQLVQRVIIYDEAIPGNAAARGATNRTGSVVTLSLTRESMNVPIYVKHELLHTLQYAHPELFGPGGQGSYPGDHWPLLFDPYGTT